MQQVMEYRPEYYQQKRVEMIQFLPEHYSRVLEVGCGEGRFAENLKPCEYWGVEPVETVAQAAKHRLARVLVARFEECHKELPNEYFDLIVCNDVMEHMTDHSEFLRVIRAKMTPGACLVGSLPNVRHARLLYDLIVRKDWRYVDAGVLERGHLRFFTERSLKRTLHDHRFSVELLKGLNSVMSRPTSWRELAKAAAVISVLVLSLGFYSDIRFLRFGFRARLSAMT